MEKLLMLPILMLTKQQNKTRTTCKTCIYDAFFYQKKTSKTENLSKKKSNSNTSNQTINIIDEDHNCRIYYSQNRCFISYKDFCLL